MSVNHTVGVIGLGSVGSAVIHSLSRKNSCVGYDTCGEYDWDAIPETDFAFICVPTPSKEGRLDNSIVDSVLKKLNDHRYKGIVIIKSTLGVGAVNRFEKEYPLLRIVYMPEFLRELNPYSWCENPDRIVISGKDEDCESTLSLIDPPSDVPVLRMSHSEAELGKLAHNAFIATKVSFTNMIETISDHCDTDPKKVMSVIWTDRRVNGSAHLMPGIGGYSGKCIPKDTSELSEFAKSEELDIPLLIGVEETNGCVRPSTMDIPMSVHVIISTSQQDGLIERAISSVCEQCLKPKSLVIVYDEPLGEELLSIVEKFKEEINISLIPNGCAKNLSGAINTGLGFLEKMCSEDDFIALLDDDDFWDYRYLQNCLTFAHDMKCDWVVSGLVRIDQKYPKGAKQTIPESITIHDFLIGNPNVQGSNLFVKADPFLKINGFDEDLISTTDRDVCIRLLKVPGIRVGFLRNHLVHHDCLSRTHRLSDPGSDRKREGLIKFFKKYYDTMDPEEIRLFKERASNLFGVDTQDDKEGSF